ncbi:hypothetical protein OF83DRAFT_1221904, partial [Amylostereum chailletii]
SRIARNVKNFETWCTYQGCETVAFSDIPRELKKDVDEVFNTSGHLPVAWVDPSSTVSKAIAKTSSTEFMKFLRKSYKDRPELFSDDISATSSWRLLDDLRCVFTAWDRLRQLRASSTKVSEAEFVANVYEVFRSPAVSQSAYRPKCSISLAQPRSDLRPSAQSLRVINATTVIPDCAVFIPNTDLFDLFHSAKSPFKKLNKSKLTGAGKGEKSFSNQCTPCAQLPSMPCFEFASSFWEDKKPLHHMLEDAYRQNRMSTTASVRHLHSLHVRAPVFGLVWADGTVRAHVDWCASEWGKPPAVQSAPFPGLGVKEEGGKGIDLFHEWRLDKPADILQVFLLIRNIDQWTVGSFRTRVGEGIRALETSVLTDEKRYIPWKKVGKLTCAVLREIRHDENTTSQQSSTDDKPRRRTRRRSS